MQGEKDLQKGNSGLLENGKPEFLAIARISKPHGLKGEVSAEILTDFPERIVSGCIVFLGEELMRLEINTCRRAGKRILISFKDYISRDQIEVFRNKVLYIPGKELPELSNDEFYFHQLIGLEVENSKKEKIGILKEVIRTGANDVYVITTNDSNGKEILIPAIKAVVKEVDLESKKMIVELPEWL